MAGWTFDKTKKAQNEWGIVLIIAIGTAVIGMVPYLLGSSLEPEGQVYMHLIMNPEDAQTYWAKMVQGYNGHILYTIPFTPEPHTGAFIGAFYLWLGHLSRLLNITLTSMWYWARVVCSTILFLVTFRFVAAFLPDRQERWLAYMLALFGSGLGWVLFMVGQPYWLGAFPVDFKQPGAHLFFTALTFPHITLGTAMILFSVMVLKEIGDWRLEIDNLQSLIPNLRSNKRLLRTTIGAGCGNILLGIAYPFLIYIVAATAVLHWSAQAIKAKTVLWAKGTMTAILFLIPAPLYLYYLSVWRTNDVFRTWDIQAGTPSAPWPHYLVAFGPMLLLGIWHWWKKPDERSEIAILWWWVLAVALLLYAPLNPQRRFVQGVHVPLAILGALGFTRMLLPRWQQTRIWQAIISRPRYETAKLSRLLTIIFLLVMSLSNIYLFADVSRIAALTQPDPFFRPVDEVVAANWLHEEASETAVILGDYQTGNYIAARTGRRVILGHWAETVDYEGKTAAVARFFDASTTDAWRQAFMETFRVGYVWHGPREKALGRFDPETAVYLKPVFSNETITIYARAN